MASNLARFDPFRDIARLDPFRSIDSLLREFPLAPAGRGFDAERIIRVDVQETGQAYVVKADLPGLGKKDIKVEVDGNVVSISTATQGEREQERNGMVYSERYSGTQYRSFSLPQDVDGAKAEAKYEDGVLHLTLPKKAGTARKEIAIR